MASFYVFISFNYEKSFYLEFSTQTDISIWNSIDNKINYAVIRINSKQLKDFIEEMYIFNNVIINSSPIINQKNDSILFSEGLEYIKQNINNIKFTSITYKNHSEAEILSYEPLKVLLYDYINI
jgi:hypothetical protein